MSWARLPVNTSSALHHFDANSFWHNSTTTKKETEAHNFSWKDTSPKRFREWFFNIDHCENFYSVRNWPSSVLQTFLLSCTQQWQLRMCETGITFARWHILSRFNPEHSQFGMSVRGRIKSIFRWRSASGSDFVTTVENSTTWIFEMLWFGHASSELSHFLYGHESSATFKTCKLPNI